MSKSAPSAENAPVLKDGPLDIYKFRWLFIGISILFLVPGVYFICANIADPELRAPLRLGIDFRGGTLLEYGFSKPVVQSDVDGIKAVFDEHGYSGSVVQIQQPRAGINQQLNAQLPAETATPSSNKSEPGPSKPSGVPATATLPENTPPEKGEKSAVETPSAIEAPAAESGKNIATIVSIRSQQIHGQDDVAIRHDLEAKYGQITVLQKNSIGPALAKELLTNGLLALVLAYLLIVGYLTVRFQFDFAVCAMIALVHDTLFLVGMFAMFGRLFHTEVDSLLITALLTVVGFSVHDTIVVFDRVRENSRIYFTKKVPFVKIVNMSINQTMARSINTSLTALLTMLALYFFGGETTKDFVLAIILGIAAGTYSSIFNASVILAMWRNRTQGGGAPTTTSLPNPA